MSLVTSATLVMDYCPKHVQEALLAPLPENIDSRRQAFGLLANAGEGGFKISGNTVFQAGFNYVLPTDLVDWVHVLLGPLDGVMYLNMEDDPDVIVFGKVRTKTALEYGK